MTSDWLIDSSVAVKWVVTESDSALAERMMADVIAAGRRLFVLDFGHVEVANAIRTLHRRNVLTPDQATDALARFRPLPVTIVEAHPLLDDAFALALQFNIAVYDALFVAAVRNLGCNGVTADNPLMKALGGAFPAITLLADW